jgi:hypothetical protein
MIIDAKQYRYRIGYQGKHAKITVNGDETIAGS